MYQLTEAGGVWAVDPRVGVYLSVHCKETITKIRNKYSQKRHLRGLSPNFYIHVSVRDLYISTIDLPILLQENRWTDPGNI